MSNFNYGGGAFYGIPEHRSGPASPGPQTPLSTSPPQANKSFFPDIDMCSPSDNGKQRGSPYPDIAYAASSSQSPSAPSLPTAPREQQPSQHTYQPSTSFSSPPSYPQPPSYSHQPSFQQQPQGVQQFSQHGQISHSLKRDEELICQKLMTLVQQNKLEAFYKPRSIQELAKLVAQTSLHQISSQWRIPARGKIDLFGLSLYDTYILCDNSGSMKLFDNGSRIEEMRTILERISSVCGLLDTDGISVFTLNTPFQQDNVRNSTDVANFVNQMTFDGGTPLGTQLNRKVIEPYVLRPAKAGALPKPVHIIIITDGEPNNEPSNEVRRVIANAKDVLKKTKYGGGAVAFCFAQVGCDQKAADFLAKLDTDSKVGKMVDCTSSFEMEQEEYLKKSGLELLPDMYLNKLCLGAIDQSYDQQDEAKKTGFFKKLFK